MIYLHEPCLISPLGDTLTETLKHLGQAQTPYMAPMEGVLVNGKTAWIGRVPTELPSIPPVYAKHASRNNQLLLAATLRIETTIQSLIQRYGSHRIGIVLGTSTSGLDSLEQHLLSNNSTYAYEQQELGDPSRFLAQWLGLQGPAYTISTACTSSSRAFISGAKLLRAGLVDAVIVGGVDTLCNMTLNGFSSLEAISPHRCNPFGAKRNGITIGEAVGLTILSKEPSPLALLGFGESSDAWHISAPHPEGLGIQKAMRDALSQAKLSPEQVGYINLHGTGTVLNDQMEAHAVYQVFGNQVPCSSSKYLTGHTLGAAGVCEAIISCLLLQHRLPLPPQHFLNDTRDETLAPIQLVESYSHHLPTESTTILSNSCAFGGNNTALLFGSVPNV